MSKLSDVEYRAARAQWHLEMAIAAKCSEAAERHSDLARRYADPREAISEIEQPRPN